MQAYWKSLTISQRVNLASLVSSSSGYLRLVFKGHKRASHSLAKKIEVATNGAVTKEQLRPDIYGD
ncbi:YdaS family helix-turn-helix protein [Yersinia proxima]|uniref:YdaS family helix-turn-helix protein n=1 Tax=Yersinia proxima TaxID=2890316 RepID=UPI001D103427|nr:YdaS family helix-turn-helix protein [Yersinia proxima]